MNAHDDLADIVLILEGTYPFVMGGVSSWVHRLISEMPELRFGIVHIAPRAHYYGDKPAYKLPPNVVFLEELGLLPPRREPRASRIEKRRHDLDALWGELLRLRDADPSALPLLGRRCEQLALLGTTPEDVLAGPPCWDALLACYEREAVDQSFVNFFWTWRFAWQPLVELLFQRVPRGGMYHTVSTGYAGLLAALASARWQRPMILTEDGKPSARIGIAARFPTVTVRHGFVEAVKYGSADTIWKTGATFQGIFGLFLSPKSIGQSVSGPVAIIEMSGQAARRGGHPATARPRGGRACRGRRIRPVAVAPARCPSGSRPCRSTSCPCGSSTAR